MKFTLDELIKITNGKLIENESSQLSAKSHQLKASSIVTDSRLIKKGDLFVALSGRLFDVVPGSSHDGHDFLKEALENGASGALVSYSRNSQKDKLIQSKFKFVIQVKDTLDAYQAIARFWREKFDIPVIAITGSNGKTTTKNMVTSVVSKKYRVLSSAGGVNNQVGVPATLLRLNENHQVAVLEVGTNRPGEIKILNHLIKPTIAIITNIGPVHLEQLGTLLGVAKEKAQILNGVDYAILNQDDDFFDYLKSRVKIFPRCRTSGETSGLQKNTQVLSFGSEDFYDQNRKVAQRVGEILGISQELINQGLESYEHPKMRMEEIKKESFTIINDAYNANPVSMQYALKIFSRCPCSGYRITILGDMLELGSQSKKYHDLIGNNLPTGIDVLITVGDQARYIAEAAKKSNRVKTVAIFKNNKLASSFLGKIVKKGDLVLLKASRGMKFEEILDNFK
ncbi:UDP-N-acetylmuramoyl-tripeptide--D-alanyl-D-alanine ligase [Candidatus Azambacteria bacterium]|nr:UDP-N-acetylmuramoyl-tripeptide--D-alanyl-D-alanine ligase [Candidatus Azambacteria bacterium]